MPTKNSLLFFREKINKIDKNIVKLLAERKNLVLEIAKSKRKNKQKVRDLAREEKMLNELTVIAKKNNLQPEYITRLFQLIIEESVLTQKKLLEKLCNNSNSTYSNFAILGPKGSYSHIAACEYANRTHQKYAIKECATFENVILSVETNQSNYAVLPIENTCSGFINEVLVILEHTNLFIVGEINIFIDHCVLATQKITLDKIQNIYSHPQPFKQCSHFIKQFPKWKINYTKSTADAMKIISEYNQPTNAALGSEIGSKIYGLQILSKNLANKQQNITRFIILQRNPIKISENISHKTTLIFNIEQNLGSLDNVLFILKEKKIIITKLTSRTLEQNPRKEMFYIDLKIDLTSTLMEDTLKKIKKFTKFIKILGCYPCENVVPIISKTF